MIRALHRNEYHYLIVVGPTAYGAHCVMRLHGRRGIQRVYRPLVCASPDEAARAAARLVREKERRGYREFVEEIEEVEETRNAPSQMTRCVSFVTIDFGGAACYNGRGTNGINAILARRPRTHPLRRSPRQ